MLLRTVGRQRHDHRPRQSNVGHNPRVFAEVCTPSDACSVWCVAASVYLRRILLRKLLVGGLDWWFGDLQPWFLWRVLGPRWETLEHQATSSNPQLETGLRLHLGVEVRSGSAGSTRWGRCQFRLASESRGCGRWPLKKIRSTRRVTLVPCR